MKKIYALIGAICLTTTFYAQCMMQVVCYPPSCYGGCDGFATAYANGVPPFNYQWSNGGTTQTINGLCAGTYTCVMTDSAGCVATAQCSMNNPPQLSVAICNFQNPSCQSCCDGFATACATGGTAAYTYYWTPTNQTSVTAQALCAGTYTVCVTDANGCTSCTTVTMSAPTSVPDQGPVYGLTINPQDASGNFAVNASFQQPSAGQVIVTDMLGQTVHMQSFDATSTLQMEIDLSGNAPGVYFVSVVTNSGTATQRVVNN